MLRFSRLSPLLKRSVRNQIPEYFSVRSHSQQRITIKGGLLTKVDPYLRLVRFDKPIGSVMLFTPCAWSILAAQNMDFGVTASSLALCAVGAIAMRGAGCIVNDYFDRDIDCAVERTRSRPLATGELGTKPALAALSLHLAVALGVLLQFNWPSIAFCSSSLVLVATYPLTKRIIKNPQAYLGLTFSWGIPFGFLALIPLELLTSTHGLGISFLYVGNVLWVYLSDTVYAMMDRRDDEIVGIASSALWLEKNKCVRLALNTAALLGGTFVAVGGCLLNSAAFGADIVLTSTIFGSSILAATALMSRIVFTTDFDNTRACQKAFHHCALPGVLVSVGLLAEYSRQYYKKKNKKMNMATEMS